MLYILLRTTKIWTSAVYASMKVPSFWTAVVVTLHRHSKGCKHGCKKKRCWAICSILDCTRNIKYDGSYLIFLVQSSTELLLAENTDTLKNVQKLTLRMYPNTGIRPTTAAFWHVSKHWDQAYYCCLLTRVQTLGSGLLLLPFDTCPNTGIRPTTAAFWHVSKNWDQAYCWRFLTCVQTLGSGLYCCYLLTRVQTLGSGLLLLPFDMCPKTGIRPTAGAFWHVSKHWDQAYCWCFWHVSKRWDQAYCWCFLTCVQTLGSGLLLVLFDILSLSEHRL